MLPKGKETASSDFNDLESNTREITLSVSGSTETSDKNLVIFFNERHTTISWNVGGNSLVVLFELNSDALSNTGVRLLRLNSDFLDDDTSGMRSINERLLPLGSGVSFFVTEIGPPVGELKVRK